MPLLVEEPGALDIPAIAAGEEGIRFIAADPGVLGPVARVAGEGVGLVEVLEGCLDVTGGVCHQAG